jgi:hypothetical protein
VQFHNGNIHWNIIFTRPIHDWEVEVVSRFFELLYSQRVRHRGEDTICWIPFKKKLFEVKSYYQVLSNPTISILPWKSTRKLRLPREAFFVKMAELGQY